MTTFKETVLGMVARKELTAAQAMQLIERVRESRGAAPAARQPVAIIGMSARFPGAGDVDTFWSNIRAGVCSVGEIPRERWNVDDLYDPDPQAAGKTYCKWGGFLDGVDDFDASFFNISSKEAQFTDPQQRLFLEEAYRALEDAGLSAERLDGARCGVFAGAGGGDFIHQISAEGITPDAYAFMGNSSSILAARISYHLNLKGPSLAVDTACSSSLVAMHLACESLALGTSELALAGGVCVLSTPNFFLAGSKAGMLSRGGACRTFDRDADGFVPAEGVGVLVLKPLDRALADGDRIHGVIEGSAINQDGRTNGITAPSAPSQTALELEVYEKFGISPETIGYVEAHGTGTRLGDPIEIEALTAAFRRFTGERGFCAIGSSKSNIGHAMSASGIAGVVKVLKAMQAGELPPSLHFQRENEAIGFAGTPFRVNTALEQWPRPASGRRRAAVSSFGFSGTNAHVVIAEPPGRDEAPLRAGTLPFAVSAKSRAALEANCEALAEWLEHHPEMRLDSVSYTLLAGRTHYEHRRIVQAASHAELATKLRAGVSEGKALPSVQSVFGDTRPPKLSLPSYRFEGRSHRLGTATRPKRTYAPHPLIDEQRENQARSRWDATLPFLRDHRVLGSPILPGACLVEMALAATRAQALADVVFRSPLQLAGVEVEIELAMDGGAFTFRSAGREIASGRVAQSKWSDCTIDIDEWTSREAVDVEALFRRFDASGVALGPYCRGLRRLWTAGDEAFAELHLPTGESRSAGYYTMHPTLVDGAFQAAMALLAGRAGGVLVPASVGTVSVRGPLPAICYAHIRLTGARTFDVAFFDENGNAVATLHRFGVSELHSPADPPLRYYRPVWAEIAETAPASRTEGVTLVVRAPDVPFAADIPSPSLEVVLSDRTAPNGTGQWEIDASAPHEFERLLADLKPLARIVFLGGRAAVERDVVALLHLARALPRRREATRPLNVVVAAPPENGAIIGFAQTLSREESRLRFTVLECDAPSARLFDEAGEEQGVVLAERDGRRLRRTLVEHDVPPAGESPFRRGGVYVIAGGAGGLGLEVARHLSRTHDARVILLGRGERAIDAGPNVIYHRADVTDREAMQAIVEETKARYGAIHGVIHAAMVLRDVRVEKMDEATLRAVLAPKLHGSRVLAAVFANEPLDFFAFFSSANSFFGNAGQANYAAASMAQDAVARDLARRASYPVRILNWGFWGEVGAVATPLHRKRAQEHGVGAIRIEEGLRALEACLTGGEVQLMPMKIAPATLARMGLVVAAADEESAVARAFANVENYGRGRLRRYVGAEGRLTLPVIPKYARLRAALEAIAARPVEPHEKPVDGWTAPFARLIDRCLDHYPEVLAGTMNPADVLFPGGSTEWVAPLYRDNPIVDRYNEVVAEEVVARVEELLRTRARVRVFEMGAGTGGTSRGVLERLARFGGRAELVFTDLSAGLVRQAKSELAERYPSATFAVFDMEKPPRAQGFEEHAYDVVFASNALHATRNVAASLRNARALLHDGGLLLLNEGIRLHDFSTLTFGLTDGWWLFEDPDARLPHSPLLDETLWRRVLAEAFEEIEVQGGGQEASQAVFVARAKRATAARSETRDPSNVERLIRRQVASLLGVTAAEIDVDRRFSELGIDSILGVDLVRRVNDALRTDASATVLFDHPSVRQLARHLGASAVIETPAAAAGVEEAPRRHDAIAVVGLAGRFPGARNAREFWRDLRDGVCRIGEVPRERWDVGRYYDPAASKPGKSPCKWGGFLDDIDKFDPSFFHMSGAEAEYTDPQQRLFVEEAWHALEDAGYAPAWLDGKRCGVFVGAGAGDYIHRMTANELQPQAFLGNGVSVLASRISYLLNLRGPALAVDTACSSSLLAVHLACQSIRAGECDLALAGGVFVSTTPSFHYLTGRLGMLSPSGRCRAFDDGADGFIPGEGVGAIVLRPLDAALRDGDFIYGVIAGSGANQDGHSNGITAPSALSQAELEAEVYTRAGVDPRTISYVEAHGTGTRLGDPLEIEGLTTAFRRFTADRSFCAIGSLKTNIGHAGPAAGIAGLIKVLLAMRHREIPPSLHFDRPNRAIDFAATPFYVATERRPWSAQPMRAAVSAFGLSGTNVHVVVEEAPPAPAREPRSSSTPVFVVSAMTEEALRERIAGLESWLAEEGHEHDPRDVAYTLAVGRKHFRHRAVIGGDGHALAQRYLAGDELDWAAEYPPDAHRRVPLPGYPFSRERYWIPDAAEATRHEATAAPADPAVPAEVFTFERTWAAASAPAAEIPSRIALLGATTREFELLHTATGVEVTRDVAGAESLVLMPRFCDSVEGYLDLARNAAGVRRVIACHAPSEHAAIATSALHASLRHVHQNVVWQTLECGADPIADVARELRTAPDAAEVRYRGGREALRCAPIVLESRADIQPGSVWWITGGTGRIGMRVARWLVECHDARVVLTARRAPAEPLGRQVELIAADVSDRAAMRRVRDEIVGRFGALHGVVHAAGAIDAPKLDAKADSRAVLAPKIDGALILDELTRDLALDHFVLFSSLSAIAGDFGQCDYAAANRWLESFAEWRAARRTGRTVVIHWPLWADGGMHLPEADERRYLRNAGLEALPTEDALRVLEQAMGSTRPVVVVARGERARVHALLGCETLQAVAPVASARTAVAASESDILRIVRERTADVVRLPLAKLTPETRFSDVGLDSLYMKDLAAALSGELGVAITPTAFFEHQTIGALAGHLRVAYAPVLRGAAEVEAQAEGASGDEPIAIIGMSGRFPQSADLEALWAHFLAGDDCVSEVPPERWDWRAYQAVTGREHDKSVSRWGGFMPDVDRFDCAFFGISPREAVYMDPQHRLFLQSVWSAFEDAGVRPSSLAGRKVGVWAGAQLNEYMGLIGDAGAARAQAALGNTQTMLANRVSYCFDFRGPSQTVDTACSSSLVAVHRAVQSLRSGECELAVAGGVSAILSPDTYVLASRLGMLSPDGRCKTFDSTANGYVKGEGVGAVLLKPLSRALNDGDHVYAVIRGTAEGHGGKASSLTAPNPQAQAEVVADAWRRANVPIDSVSYIETHGTGTELGDPIEVGALTSAFRALAAEQRVSLRERFCGLGAAKSNIGHLEPAAGIAGLIKVVLSMRERMLPPTLHVAEVNPYLRIEESPFRLVTEATEWNASPLRAGVSAFGFGGSNAHVAIEEGPAREGGDGAPFDAVVPISARTPEALRERVEHLAAHLERPNAPAWRDVAFTLIEGRERFEQTIAFGASSVTELVAALRAWLRGVSASIPPTLVTTGVTGRRVPLPSYPFARTRIWFDRQRTAPAPALAVPPADGVVAPVANAALEEIRTMLAELLYLEPAAIADDARFVELGLDSILAVEFAKKLRDRFGVDLRATRLYDYSTLGDLSAIVGDAQPVAPEAPPAADAPLDEIRTILAELLYLEPAAIADDARFVELGLDSILAVEFAKKLRDRFGVDLRATRLYDYSTLGDLSAIVGGAQPVAPEAPPAADAPLEEIRTILAELLYLEPAAIADDAKFVELGLDSILAVEFAKKLRDRFGVDLRATRLYDYSTLADLSAIVGTAAPAAGPAPVTTIATPEIRDSDVAIIGMSGRFPGARDLDSFWRNLAAGVDSITDVPRERWSVEDLYPHKTYCRRGGFLEDVDQFDPLFFQISPQEAEWMDPQQRLFLEEAWLALEDAGLPDRTLSGAQCAVFAGAGQGDYFRLMDADGEGSAQFGIGNVSSILAARIAYLLNLKGPAVSLDTACSSSLVAVHLASQALRSGECDFALAGGVSLMLTPQMHILTSQTRMLSPEGMCKTFDTAANGFVPGEAAGVVVLRRLRDAVASGDRIYAVIRGSGTNQDGKTNGITAPSAQSQTALQLAVYERFGIDPSTLTYVEAHGTGTKLGDPIEVDALTDSFRRYTDATRTCAIGSVKTNIGHTLPAAGIAGVIKTVLALRARQIPPTLHCSTENEEINFARSPFYVNTQLRDWTTPVGMPRRAAVSSFGFSGTNAHVVLEEWGESPPTSATTGPWSFVLSARTRESLVHYAQRLADWLEGDGAAVPLADIAFTLTERRTRFRHEWVVNAADRATLVARLRATEQTSDVPLPMRAGRVVSLPPYAFSRRRCWIPERPKQPLIDAFERGLFDATARKRFDDADALLAEHVVAGAPTLPGAAHLEMALECAAEAAPDRLAALRNVIWTRPLRTGDALSVALRPDGEAIRFESPYCRGEIVFGASSEPPRIEPAASGEQYAQDDVYAAFERLGLRYGASLRRIEWLRRDAERVVAKIAIPADGSRWRLDPRVVDAALQTPIGFALGSAASVQPMLPYSLDRVTLHAPLVEPCYAVTRLLSGDGARFDIALVAEDGRVLVELSGFQALPLAAPAAVEEVSFLQTRWRIAANREDDTPPLRDPVALFYTSDGEAVAQTLASRHVGDAAVAPILLGGSWREEAGQPFELDHRSTDDWDRLARALPPLRRVYFLGGWPAAATVDGAAVDEFQEHSSLALLRLVRAWSRADRALPEMVVVTRSAFEVLESDAVAAQAASLAGLSGVIGREMPGVEVTHVDVDTIDAAALAFITSSARTGAFAVRKGELFAPRPEPLQLRAAALGERSAFRRGGVYVIFGGSGGIGGALAEHLAREHHARIAIAGRRDEDDAIRSLRERIGDSGGEAIYVACDVGDRTAVERARDAALAKWGAVHGVIHSAFVLRDQTIARLDDASMRETLRAKGRGTCNIAEVFENVATDWILLFSSTISYTQNAGQASYAAASTLQDAIGAAFARRKPGLVRTINWGYWGDVGAVATEKHRSRARSLGVGSIGVHEAVDAIERVLRDDVHQCAAVKLLERKETASPLWHRNEQAAPPFAPLRESDFARPVSRELRRVAELLSRVEQCGRRIAGAQTRTLDESRVDAAHRPLVAAVRAIAIDGDEREAWEELDALRAIPEVAPFAELLSAVLRGFPAVVTGDTSATEVLFPQSSAHLVESVYARNPLVDECHAIVKEVVSTMSREALSVLEAGAGTGSVTRSVLSSMGGGSYTFTDVSPHFVRAAEAALSDVQPKPRFAVLDLERDPAAQGFAAGTYDLVVAANVIHATRSIAASLQRLKKLLKRGGRLLVVEMIGRSDFSTMTFGLTPDWWKFADAERRQPHSPLLSAAQWETSLAEGGFRGTRILGARDGVGGQVVIVAESDGWYTDPPGEAHLPQQRDVTRERSAAPSATNAGERAVVEHLRAAVASVLRLRDHELDDETPFDEYGVDSLVAIDIVQKVGIRYGQLSPALLHEQNSIARLARHLLNREQAQSEPALLTLRAGSGGRRTFWAHSVLGEIDWVGRLVRHLPGHWPVHALRPPNGFAPRTLEEMAERYVAEVRAVQPAGPYVLGGYSLGGAVAFEMARQLVAAGESVDWLVLLDAYAPGSAALRSLRSSSWDGFLPAVISALLQRSRDVRPAEHELAALTERAMHIANRTAPLLDHYAPAVCGINGVLFRNRHSFVGDGNALGLQPVTVDDSERDHGWTRWLGAAPRIVELDADHFEIGLEPVIGEVADKLVGMLDPSADRVFNVVRDHVRRVLPGVPRERITLAASLRELGANSLDRVEVATCAMEDLQLSIAPTQLAGVQNIGGLVDVIVQHMRTRDRDAGASAMQKGLA